MLRAIYQCSLALCITAPKDKHNMFTFSTDQTNDSISECLPTMFLVTGCHVSPHCQSGIEQQHTLLSPSGQITRLRNRFAEVGLYLLKDVAK